MDLISVVVPVYKVEQYLDRCVESIVNQTYSNLQIILVDDGSPDHCPQMCDQWAKADPRITVVHKENGGLSDARNVGMQQATGKYLAFVDSDDWIEPAMYEQMHQRIIETGSDIVSCGAVRDWDAKRAAEPMMKCEKEVVLTKPEAMAALIQSTHLIQTVWNKMYTLEKVKDIPFEVGKIHEDEFWSWKAIARADRVATIGENYYHYLQRSDSIMGQGYTEKALLVVEAKQERHQYIRFRMPALLDMDSVDLLYTCHNQGCQVIKHKEITQRREHLATLANVCRKLTVRKDYLRKLSMTKRMRILFIQHALPLVCRADVLLGRS